MVFAEIVEKIITDDGVDGFKTFAGGQLLVLGGREQHVGPENVKLAWVASGSHGAEYDEVVACSVAPESTNMSGVGVSARQRVSCVSMSARRHVHVNAFSHLGIHPHLVLRSN